MAVTQVFGKPSGGYRGSAAGDRAGNIGTNRNTGRGGAGCATWGWHRDGVGVATSGVEGRSSKWRSGGMTRGSGVARRGSRWRRHGWGGAYTKGYRGANCKEARNWEGRNINKTIITA